MTVVRQVLVVYPDLTNCLGCQTFLVSQCDKDGTIKQKHGSLITRNVNYLFGQYKMETDTKTITVKYTINCQYSKSTLVSRNRLSEFP